MFIAQVVGRNEADRYLHDMLSNISQYVDLIVFTDDASTDDTPNIAEGYGAKVFQNPEQMFNKHEGKLRATAWSNLSMFANEGDWIISIDCDEIFYPRSEANLHKWMDSPYEVLGITFYHMWNEDSYRVDKLWAPTMSTRMYRYHEGGTYKDSALACGAEPQYVFRYVRTGRFAKNTGFRMKHMGYARNQDKVSKFNRYMELDKGKYHNINHLHSIIDNEVKVQPWSDDE